MSYLIKCRNGLHPISFNALHDAVCGACEAEIEALEGERLEEERRAAMTPAEREAEDAADAAAAARDAAEALEDDVPF
jgi:hypothetical protein